AVDLATRVIDHRHGAPPSIREEEIERASRLVGPVLAESRRRQTTRAMREFIEERGEGCSELAVLEPDHPQRRRLVEECGQNRLPTYCSQVEGAVPTMVIECGELGLAEQHGQFATSHEIGSRQRRERDGI